MVRKLRHTEIGDVPVDWKLQTFDETFRVLSNNTLSRENLNNRSGAVRNIHYGDILTKFPEVLDCNEEEIPYVNDLSLLSSSTQLLQEGDIVIADTAEDETVGKVTEVQNLGDSKLVAGLHTIPCRVKKGDFAPGWLGYYMNSNLFHNQILPYITGIKVSSISKGAISETLILVPPFDEQEKIVQSLNEVQLLMTAETKVVNKMKFVKNGCLSKMFPKNDATVPEMRLPGFTDTWEQRKLGELAEIVGGGTPSTSVESYWDGDIDWYAPAEIGEQIYLKSSQRKITEEGLNKSSAKVLPVGTVLFTSRAGIGKIAILLKEGCTNQGFQSIVPNKDKLDSYFIFTRSEELKRYGETVGAGSTFVEVSGKQMANMELMMPTTMLEQKKIGAYFCTLDHLITLHQRKCDKYLSIKKGMMSDLLTGKIPRNLVILWITSNFLEI